MTRLVYWCVLLLVAAVGIGSCRCNPKYCEGALDDNCDNLTDVAQRCTSNEECEVPTAVCDVTGSMTCVQCTPDQASACGGSTPVCGDDRMCRACRAHAECPGSDACLPDGACADPAQVAYVQTGGTGAPPCEKGAPCGTLQEGITAVNASRPYIKVSNAGGGVLTPNATTTIDGKAVIILADPGAKLDRMGDGVNLEVRNTGADVHIYDLEIAGASGGAGDVGILMTSGGMPKLALHRVRVTNNIGGGISAASGMLTVSQTTISGNNGGGLSIAAGVTFEVTNCFIVRNGNSSTTNIGGVYLGGPNEASVLAFNTIVDNQIQTASLYAGGVTCDTLGFIASNNIIVRNFVNNVPNQGNSNTLGQCVHSTSTISSTVTGLNFVSSDIAPYDYHIQRGSLAIDQATTPSTLAVDFDGDLRPQGNARDQGADEVP